MRVLALETATIEVGAAIVGQTERSGQVDVLSSRRARSAGLQVETLHPLIAEVLDESNMGLDDIDAIAVDIGPGLFTGLRVGITTAKMLAFGLDLPIVALTSTEILHAAVDTTTQPAVVVIDMRRGEVVYTLPEHPELPVLCRPEECVAMLAADESLAGALLVGDGVARFADLFGPIIERRNLVVGGDQYLAADPRVLGELAVAAMHEARYVSAFDIEPLYLREADAKINWTTRDLSQVSAQ